MTPIAMTKSAEKTAAVVPVETVHRGMSASSTKPASAFRIARRRNVGITAAEGFAGHVSLVTSVFRDSARPPVGMASVAMPNLALVVLKTVGNAVAMQCARRITVRIASAVKWTVVCAVEMGSAKKSSQRTVEVARRTAPALLPRSVSKETAVCRNVI